MGNVLIVEAFIVYSCELQLGNKCKPYRVRGFSPSGSLLAGGGGRGFSSFYIGIS